MNEKIRNLTAKGELAVFVVGVCNGGVVAMILMSSMALTLGFGVIYGFPIAAVVLAIMMSLNKAAYELPRLDERRYNVYSIFGIIIGVVLGLCISIGLDYPMITLAPESPSEVEVYAWYGLSMLAFLVLGQVIHGLATRPSKRDN